MPVRIAKRGNKYCTTEPDGTTIACFDTYEEARAQQQAINANKALVLPGVNDDGRRLMILVTSNAYRDREGEIVAERGLQEYADGKTMTTPEQNVLLFWHDGDPIGDIVYAECYKSFLIEIALERENARVNIGERGGDPIETDIKTVWDNIEATPGQWGASHGFRVIGKSNDGVIYPFDKYESSIVANGYQANWYTLSEVI